jgi:hypothetical protein
MVVRLFCDAKALIDLSLAQDESCFQSSHKEDVASITNSVRPDALRRKPANSTVLPDPRPFIATCGEHTRYRSYDERRSARLSLG